MKRILVSCLCVFALTACVENSAEYQKLKSENDSLKMEQSKAVQDFNDMLAIINEIEAGIGAIREAENFVAMEKSGEMTQNRKEQLKHNVNLIAETVKANKEQLAALEEQLKKGKVQSAALQKTISRLNNELNQKAELIASLQDELAKKDIRIQELDDIVANLNTDLESISTKSASQEQTIQVQDKRINQAFYCFGTKKELKEQNILTGGGLFSKSKALAGDFNKDYFIAIDVREVTEIPLYSNKAKLHSQHPEGSYQFQKGDNGNLTLKITDIERFWATEKYLVIEVG